MFITAFIKKILKIDKYTLEESRAIYATNTIFGLAQSLLGIFVPIYIFNLSKDYLIFSNNEINNGFIWVCSYFALSSLIVIFSIFLFHDLIFQWTLKKTIFFSKIFLIASYAGLSLSEHSLYLIFIAAVFAGIHTTFYWIPYHIFFVKRADDGDSKFGTETGRRDFFTGLSSTLGPLLGALIIAQLGFPILYGLAIILLLLATLPILIFVKENRHRRHSFKDVYFNFLKNRKYLKTSIALGGNITSNIIYIVFWSLMMYFGLNSFVDIGLLTTLSGIVSLALLLFVGKMIDKKRKLGIHTFGVFVNTVLHLTRPFFNSICYLYANGITDNINAPFYSVPFNSSVYEKSLEGSISDFLIYRELLMHGVRFLVLVLVGFLLLFTNSWTWVFYIGALGSGLTILVNF
ncbi:MFS transporter [Patescibacteria group bacterium]|nr:MFS transporter [Patescibacteria group bacterium]